MGTFNGDEYSVAADILRIDMRYHAGVPQARPTRHVECDINTACMCIYDAIKKTW